MAHERMSAITPQQMTEAHRMRRNSLPLDEVRPCSAPSLRCCAAPR